LRQNHIGKAALQRARTTGPATRENGRYQRIQSTTPDDGPLLRYVFPFFALSLILDSGRESLFRKFRSAKFVAHESHDAMVLGQNVDYAQS
jgi:hypothetical protein